MRYHLNWLYSVTPAIVFAYAICLSVASMFNLSFKLYIKKIELLFVYNF